MSTTSDPQSEPLNRIVKAPSAWLRIAATVLAIVAMMLPAVTMSMLGEQLGVSVVQFAPLALLFPLLLIAALVSPAVPALSPYTRLLDIAAAVIGVVVSLYVLFNKDNGPFGPLADGGLGFGAYLLFLATLVSIAPLIPSRYLRRG